MTCTGCRRRRRGGSTCPDHPFDTLVSATVNGQPVDLHPAPSPVPTLAQLVGLPDSIAGGDLRRLPYPCPLGPLCNYGGGGLQQLGMVITNAETGEVVHDSRPPAGVAA